MSERYEYSPLDLRQRCIRLVEIVRADEDCIECRSHVFKVLEIEEGLLFDALSYTWGPESPTREIRLDGKPFTVRENLWHALQSIKTVQSTKVPSTFAVAVRCLLSPAESLCLSYELVEAGQDRPPQVPASHLD
jgi:hypothetical protein